MWNQFETSLGKLGLLLKRFKFDGGRSGRDIYALELYKSSLECPSC